MNIIGTCAILFFLTQSASAGVSTGDGPKVTEELTTAEKKEMIQELIAEGDRYFDGKEYNRAAAVYESVFLLEPEQPEASERIDRMKKQMLKEGKAETEVLGQVYDSEIELRTRFYWGRAQQLLRDGKTAQARLELEKLLLLNPLHEEGKKRYETLKAESAEASSL